MNRQLVAMLGTVTLACFVACSGDDGTPPQNDPTFSIGGTVSGLAGSGLVLQNNGGNNLTISADGAFSFSTEVADGGSYAATVLTQPSDPSQTCTVSNGTGTVSGAAVTNVMVTCVTDTFTVGGSVTGLAGSGLVLQNNAGDDLTISANGAFTFSTALDDASAYAVTVLTQPGSPMQTCSVTDGAGSLAGANVTNVTVTCVTDTFTVGGTVTGLSGSGLVLQNNGGDDLTVTATAATSTSTFVFSTEVADGGAYAVTVATQPSMPNQLCAVANSTGTISGAAITNVAITCADSFVIGGTVTGTIGTGLVLQNNGGDDLTITATGAFAFATEIADGEDYQVTVQSQPMGGTQTCVVANPDGTVTSTSVNSVIVLCSNGDFLFEETFDTVERTTPFVGMGDAASDEANIAWISDAGFPEGTMQITGSNSEDSVGKAYVFEAVYGLDFTGVTEVLLTFDLKSSSPLTSGAVQLQTDLPGVGVVDTSNLQEQGLNEKGWAGYSVALSGIDAAAGQRFRIHFNIAAGAIIGAGGSVLIDNLRLEPIVRGCTNALATNFNAAANVNDGSCVFENEARYVVETYDDALSVERWGGFVNASEPEAVISWADGAGNPDGALSLSAVNASTDGKNYSFERRYAGFDFEGVTEVLLEFDLRSDGGVPVGTNVQLGAQLPGAGEVIRENLQNDGLSDAAWTTYQVLIENVTAASDTFRFRLSLLAGAFVGAGGTILVDNVRLVEAIQGCTNPAASNYDPDANFDDGSCDLPMGTPFFTETFDDVSSEANWTPAGDSSLGESTLAWSDGTGNPGGALEIDGTNDGDPNRGRAYIYQKIFTGLDYTNITAATLTFDILLARPLVGTAIQLQTELPGVGTVNTNDLQNQGLNETTWTTITVPYTGITTATGDFRFNVNLAAGAGVNDGGAILIDNIALTAN